MLATMGIIPCIYFRASTYEPDVSFLLFKEHYIRMRFTKKSPHMRGVEGHHFILSATGTRNTSLPTPNTLAS